MTLRTAPLRIARSARTAPRRMASTHPSSTASKATEQVKAGAESAQHAASNAGKQAQENAQDYGKLAVEYGQKAWATAQKALGPVGERIGLALGGYKEPIMYNLAVARELAKQVYVAERLAPPTSLGTVTQAYSTLWQRATNMGYWQELARTGEWKKVGVYGLEAYGIYKVGEIVGRRSLIGYNTQ